MTNATKKPGGWSTSANGSPIAEFDFDEDHSYFMVRLPTHLAALEVADSGVKDYGR